MLPVVEARLPSIKVNTGSRAKSRDGSGGGQGARFTQHPAKHSGRAVSRVTSQTGHKRLYKRDEQEEVGSYKSRGTERLGRDRIVHLRWHTMDF